jgi:hypothetical protein
MTSKDRGGEQPEGLKMARAIKLLTGFGVPAWDTAEPPVQASEKEGVGSNVRELTHHQFGTSVKGSTSWHRNVAVARVNFPLVDF